MPRYWECPKCRALLTRERLEATAGACPYCDARVGELAEFADPATPSTGVQGPGLGPIAVPPSTAAKLFLSLRLLIEQLPSIAALVLMIRLPANGAVELIVDREGLGDDPMAAVPMKLIVDLFFGPITTAGVIFLLAERMAGRRADFMVVARAGVDAWWRVFASRIIALLFIATAGAGFLIAGLPPILRALLLIPAAVLAVYYCLVDEVVVLEDTPILEARRRSAFLVAGRAWRIVVGVMWSFACLWLASMSAARGLEAAGMLHDPVARALADSVLDVFAVFQSILLFLFYWEARTDPRKDVAFKPNLEEDLV